VVAADVAPNSSRRPGSCTVSDTAAAHTCEYPNIIVHNANVHDCFRDASDLAAKERL
jgi:hypothetical protein